jgi:hypothetical protein
MLYNNIFICIIILFILNKYLNINEGFQNYSSITIPRNNRMCLYGNCSLQDYTFAGFIQNKKTKKKENFFKKKVGDNIVYFNKNYKQINMDQHFFKGNNVKLFDPYFLNDDNNILFKRKIDVPYKIEDYIYQGTLVNNNHNNKYYLYGKMINYNMNIYNYLIFSKNIDNNLRLVYGYMNQYHWSLGTPLQLNLDNFSKYGIFILSP